MWWWQILATPYPDVFQLGTTMTFTTLIFFSFSVAYEIGNKVKCFLMCDIGFPEGTELFGQFGKTINQTKKKPQTNK